VEFLNQKDRDLDIIEEKIGITVTQNIDIPNDFIKFNELVGMPRHPYTLQPMKLMPLQTDFYKDYFNRKRQVKLHLNKSRQSGWTELILRILAFESFHKYAGKKIIIIPGTREKTTKEIYGRFRDLFNNIENEIDIDGSLYLKLKNGTEVFGMPANVEAVTGWSKIGAFFMDEAAKWNLIDDIPIINSILPIVRTNESDLFMISTPKGPRGFFYHIEMDENEFTKVKKDIRSVQGWLYSKDQIDDMINSSIEDPAQEYLNQYTSGRDSIWGESFDEENLEETDELRL